MSMMVPEVATKRLELLKEAVPGISRVLVLSYLADPIAPLQVKAMQQAAGSLGVTLQIYDIRTADDLPAAFDAGAKEGAEGLLATAESIFVVQRARVSELAARYRLLAMYPYTIQVAEAGGLMAYDVDYPAHSKLTTSLTIHSQELPYWVQSDWSGSLAVSPPIRPPPPLTPRTVRTLSSCRRWLALAVAVAQPMD